MSVMIIDGTCAPPRVVSSDKNLNFVCSKPPTTPPKFINARMSTGGRAPPRIFWPSKVNHSLPALDRLSAGASPKRTTPTETFGRPKTSVKRRLVDPEVEVKKPQGRPKTFKTPISRPRENPLNEPVVTPTTTAEKPRGRPRKTAIKGFEGTSKRSLGRASKTAASSTKMLQGRPRKLPETGAECSSKIPQGNTAAYGSQGTAEGSTKRPLGRPRRIVASGFVDITESSSKKSQGKPKGLVKIRGQTPVAGKIQSDKVSSSPRVLLNQYTPKRTVKPAVGKLSFTKQRRRAGRPKKSVNNSSPKKEVGKKSQQSTSDKSSG